MTYDVIHGAHDNAAINLKCRLVAVKDHFRGASGNIRLRHADVKVNHAVRSDI